MDHIALSVLLFDIVFIQALRGILLDFNGIEGKHMTGSNVLFGHFDLSSSW